MTKPSHSENARRPVRAQRIDPGLVEAVTDLDFGRYSVTTASASAYVLDIGPESSSLVRSSRCQTLGEWEAVPLRRDGETVPLLGIIQLQLGRPAIFRLDIRGDGIETTRTTTSVCAIRRLAE
jgi:hypothetical protein